MQICENTSPPQQIVTNQYHASLSATSVIQHQGHMMRKILQQDEKQHNRTVAVLCHTEYQADISVIGRRFESPLNLGKKEIYH